MQGTSSLFITDPLDELNPEKDTTILWMQEVFSMGGQILQCEMKDLIYKDQETFATFSKSVKREVKKTTMMVVMAVYNYPTS